MDERELRALVRLRAQDTFPYELGYHHDFQGYVYGLLRGTSYQSLHDKERYKFFCFSNLIPPTRAISRGMQKNAGTISELMGCEGRSREHYYSSFESVLRPGFEFKERSRNPPENMVNCLISFGNSLLYGTVLSEIYHTQMSPTVSFLHEPGERRYSIALDLSEVFKPVIVDKVIFNLINNRIIKPEHFHEELKGCYLTDHGRRIFLKEYDEKLRTTIKHPKLGRSVSYQRLIRLECYKMVRHLLGETEYRGYRDR